jgi:hypothetical protein
MVMQEQICWVVAGADAPPPRREELPLDTGRDCSAVKAGLCCSRAGLLCWDWATYDGNWLPIIPLPD